MEHHARVQIGVDVGGTFTDLVWWDGATLKVVKVPSTPPAFERGVIDAVGLAVDDAERDHRIVHGSTVATNALLQRVGPPVAFVTTDGFRDMLLIGRQNRPKLYALEIKRPAPITPPDCWFAVRERVAADGSIVTPLDERDVGRVIGEITSRGLKHVAVCLLFSFVNSNHERLLAKRCEEAGLSVSLSSDILPEFREYERASTTAINAALRPTVETYLGCLERQLPNHPDLRIMHSAGGTLSCAEAARQAARLVLSGPAGGVLGAAHVAREAGFDDVITYDMGGTSTDVALVLDSRPQWTTKTEIDGLPLGLSMFDIHTVGAGGGSIAFLDAGGALRVGPRSAGALPGPACYARGGHEPTVTDANLLLGRIAPRFFLGGRMNLDREAAMRAVTALGEKMKLDWRRTALGITRVAEANMAAAVRAVTSRRGHDPRDFALLSFGGAGGLHACAIADALDIARVLVPPYCGVLSALGMVVAPPVVDGSKTVVHLAEQLDDERLAAEFGYVSAQTLDQIPADQTASTEVYVDARFKGQSHELKVRIHRPSVEHIRKEFVKAYAQQFGRCPEGRAVEIVTLRVRRSGHGAALKLPKLPPTSPDPIAKVELMEEDDSVVQCPVYSRSALLARGVTRGPFLIADAEATTYVPRAWKGECDAMGMIVLTRT